MRFSFHLGWVMAVAGVSLFAAAASRGELEFGLLMLTSLAGPGLVLVWLCRDWCRPLEGAEELICHGRPANATVKRVDEVSLESDGSRTARLTVHVTPLHETSYRATQRVTLPHGRVPAVGEAVAIRFDPNRRRQFALPALGQ